MKQTTRLSIILFALLFLYLLIPLQQADAADRSYRISGYIINVNVNRDGSADIEERLTYRFKGQFNGVLRDVDFSQTDGLSGKQVFVEKYGSLAEFIMNDAGSFDANSQPGTYNYSEDGSIAHFKIFEPSEDETKTFVIKYRLLDVVTVYNDIAEFNRKLIDKNWKTRLDNISIKVTLPEGALKEEIKVFAHGPLEGVSKIVDAQNVEFEVPSVSAGNFVETLVLFPPKLVPDSRNNSGKDALPGIMANEGKLAEEANKQREQARTLVMIGYGVTAILSIIWIFLIIFIYLKYDKELRHSFQGKYYRELPGEYTPAEMSVLLSFGNVQSRDIMATLMDLVRKRQLALNSGVHKKDGFFGSKDIQTYVISLRPDAQQIPLKSHEQYLMDWFLGKIGDGMSVNLEEIKEYVKKRNNALQFKSDYDKWVSLAKEEANRNNFFDDASKKGRLLGVLSGLLYMGIGIFIIVQLGSPVPAILVLLGLILLIFSARIKRCTAYGNEQRAMWHAFKNFLKDFSRMDKATLPSIVMWEFYLVYAISLGVAKEVIKQLPLVFNDNDLNNAHLTYMYGGTYGYFSGFNTVFNETIHTVESTISSAVSTAYSASSSSSGGGGGFSGGSSGGGGGGGGGGAF